MEPKVRLIAFYLPQYHPIPENDEWWGKGFTEWTNVTKAKPLFKGHYQPHLPADLGFYDLRVPEVREAQAALAREYGFEAFCYWHYYFGGGRLLERPFQELLESSKPDFPFCLGWANETWSGLWSGGDKRKIIKEQDYPGREDYKRHFEILLPAFCDPRHVRVDGKPLFLIYKPLEVPDCRSVLDYWRELANKAGLAGLHLVANLESNERNWDARAHGFDAVTIWPIRQVVQAEPCLRIARVKRFLARKRLHRLQHWIEARWPGRERVYDYASILPQLICESGSDVPCYPMAIPNWDTTPRYDANAIIFHNSTPEAFRLHLRAVFKQVEDRPVERRIVFLKSWNEWAEGNHMEPDYRYGHDYLKVVKEELLRTVEPH